MKRILVLVTAALVMAAMMAALAVPAFASQPEGFVGGGGGMCELEGDIYSCQFGSGVNVAGDPDFLGVPAGGGLHFAYDPATGDYTLSGGTGAQWVSYDENGLEIVDPGGYGYHCEGSDTEEQVCVGGDSF